MYILTLNNRPLGDNVYPTRLEAQQAFDLLTDSAIAKYWQAIENKQMRKSQEIRMLIKRLLKGVRIQNITEAVKRSELRANPTLEIVKTETFSEAPKAPKHASRWTRFADM
jgi:hypothetical protein